MSKPSSLRHGLKAGLFTVILLAISALPSRLMGVLHAWGSTLGKIEKLFGGALVDISAVLFLLTPVVAVLSLLLPLVVRRLRRPAWQQLGSLIVAFPLGFVVYLLTVVAQEVKSERGSFPTMYDLAEGGSNASFVGGSLGFVRYDRIWIPCVAGLLLTALFSFIAVRALKSELAEWKPWAAGLVAGLTLGTLTVMGTATALAHINRFSPAALGDPLTGLVESTVDLFERKGPSTPRELVLTSGFKLDPAGAALMGWPPTHGSCATHLHERPLDTSAEPPIRDERGRALVTELEAVSRALFADDDEPVALFQLSLEGFRADDLHALNPQAAPGIAPFTSALYERPRPGILTSSKMFQAGVRTAHCLGAMMCGLGTLPYNLSFIRDLQPFPTRCAVDVLNAAGFESSFFYGSDVTFDEMGVFFKRHGFSTIMSQAELPADLPKGTWDGLTDFAVFDQAVKHVKNALEQQHRSQFMLLMSLSNHSPFTAPQDLPAAVQTRVDEALKTVVNRADADDRLRLITHSYTDAAVEKLFEALDTTGLSARSLVVLMADHSTGHAYVWGPVDPETDVAKSQIPFAIVIPPAFIERVKNRAALLEHLQAVQKLLDAAPLSQNDVPRLMLALLSAQPQVVKLPKESRWHSLGGQVTSPYFAPGGDARSYILGINGVSELFALDRSGARVGNYEDSVFLKTRADRYRVTPRLIPVTSTLVETMQCSEQTTAAH